MKIKIFLSVLLLSFSVAFANEETDKLCKQATEQYNDGKTEKAIKTCEDAISKDKNCAPAYIVLCEIYINSNDFKNAFKYAKIADKIGKDNPLLYYYAGYSLLRQGKYVEGKSYYDSFNALKFSDENKRERAKIEAASCALSADAIKTPLKLEYKKLKGSINNSEVDEFSPSLSATGTTMFFLKKTQKKNLSIFKSTLEKTKWGEPVELEDIVDKGKEYNGVSTSYPERYLFFSRIISKNYDIYYAVKTAEDRWTNPESVGKFINTKFDEMSPACFFDGENVGIIFSSNRLDGMGYDLWSSKMKTDGSWESPVTLGKEINTKFDETAPFVSHDGSFLIYSTDGLAGFGGKDYFISKFDKVKKTWSKPINLGFPINDYTDNEGICVTPDSKTIYASYNKGYKGYDICSINIEDNFFEKILKFENKKPSIINNDSIKKFQKIKISYDKLSISKDTIEKTDTKQVKIEKDSFEIKTSTKIEKLEFKKDTGKAKIDTSIKERAQQMDSTKKDSIKTQIIIDSVKKIKEDSTLIVKEEVNTIKEKQDIKHKEEKSLEKINTFAIKFSYEEYKIVGKKLNEFKKIEDAITEKTPEKILVIGYPDGRGDKYFDGELARARALFTSNLLKKKYKNIKISYEYKKNSNETGKVEIILIK